MKKKIINLFIIFSLFFTIFNGASCNLADNSIIKTITGGSSVEAGTKEIKTSLAKLADIMAGVASTIALIFVLIGAFNYITSAGDEGKVTKAKGTITWALIGLILILSSYIIINSFINIVTGK